MAVRRKGGPSPTPLSCSSDDRRRLPAPAAGPRGGEQLPQQLIQLTGAATHTRLPVVEFGSLEGILGCVAAGMGVTLLPAAVVQHSAMRTDLRLHTLPAPLSRAETVFIRRADSPLGPAMHRFIEELDQIGASETTMIDRTA